ncbi:ComEA family DNA-binding protein [Pseudomonas fluorescens]|uniref:Competence protein ComEA n=1 Tax=Pseudomonas fluorescens TaxID=294 RepID=A0A5E7FCE5_PSEFL|nr:ComEA family DNA-binding protein [Pseudomonas fluorescens]VVO37000.1 hypothetical protein PS723_05464 [Pseudomonas fluorescens]
MRTAYFSSLVFALLASISLAVNAAPAKSETAAPVSLQGASAEQATRINLNTADAATLQRELSGIGEAKAKAIVAYRESNGSYTSVDELLEVKGIGKAILDKNRDMLEIK